MTTVYLLRPLPLSEKLLTISRDLLPEDDLHRAFRFRFEVDKARHLSTRVALRVVLTYHLKGYLPGDFVFGNNSYGKPFLLEPSDTSIHFNVSHSGDYVLIAVSKDCEVGVDIEQINHPGDLQSIAKRFFTSQESQVLSRYPQDERKAAFCRCWTLKEAFIKAVGMGLSLPLSSFEVPVSNDSLPFTLKWTSPKGTPTKYTLTDVPIPECYYGALAVEGCRADYKLNIFDWERELSPNPSFAVKRPKPLFLMVRLPHTSHFGRF